jgi:hypothetical protein
MRKINPVADNFCRISPSHGMQNASVRVERVAACLKCQGFLLKSTTLKNFEKEIFSSVFMCVCDLQTPGHVSEYNIQNHVLNF